MLLVWAVAGAAAWAVGAGGGRALTVSLGSNLAAKPAGFGAAPVAPYTVSAVAYALNSSSPQNLDSVTFTLSPTNASTVTVEIGGNWYPCSGSGSITCATTSPVQATASAAASGSGLIVAAAQ